MLFIFYSSHRWTQPCKRLEPNAHSFKIEIIYTKENFVIFKNIYSFKECYLFTSIDIKKN